MFARKQSFFYLAALLLSVLLPFLPMLAIERVRDEATRAVTANASWPVGISTTEVIAFDPFMLLMALLGLLLFSVLLLAFLGYRKPAFQRKMGIAALLVYAGAIAAIVLSSVVPLTVAFLEINGERLLDGYVALPLTYWFYAFATGILFVVLGNRAAANEHRKLRSAGY